MSFSFQFLPIPEDTGPLNDIFVDFTFDTLAYYFISWAKYIMTSWWFQWIVWGALVWLGIRVMMYLISAFNQQDVDARVD